MRVTSDFSQRTADQQEHSGAVVGSTLEVGYSYEDGSRANTTRRKAMTYPDGRQLDYGYGANTGTDDRLSRVATTSIMNDHRLTHAAAQARHFDYIASIFGAHYADATGCRVESVDNSCKEDQ